MNFILELHSQLQSFKNTLLFEIDNKEITHNYHLAEIDYRFLDSEKLYVHLMETSVANTVFHRKINELCEHIIYLWENEIKKLSIKPIDEDLKHLYGDDPINNTGDFLICYFEYYSEEVDPENDMPTLESVADDHFNSDYLPFSNSDFSNSDFLNREKEELFRNQQGHNRYKLANLVVRCEIIKNLISDAYPETLIKNEEESVYLKERIYFNTSKSLIDSLINPCSELKVELSINSIRKKHPDHDPNLWNIHAFSLFKYLFDFYYSKYKKQLTNMWFYLKEYNSDKYTLLSTKEKYVEFVKMNYNIELKNFDKSIEKYNNIDFHIMDSHRINFEETFKLNKNTKKH